MALIKTITDNKGQSTSYHKIGLFNVNAYTNMIDINMVGYTLKEYRDIEKTENTPAVNVVSSTPISVPAEMVNSQTELFFFDDLDSEMRFIELFKTALYVAIKQIPEWSDAIDG